MSAALKVRDTLPCPPPSPAVTLYIVHEGMRDIIAEVEFDADQCAWTEALLDAGYPELCRAEWESYPQGQYRHYVNGRLVHVAEVTL